MGNMKRSTLVCIVSYFSSRLYSAHVFYQGVDEGYGVNMISLQYSTLVMEYRYYFFFCPRRLETHCHTHYFLTCSMPQSCLHQPSCPFLLHAKHMLKYYLRDTLHRLRRLQEVHHLQSCYHGGMHFRSLAPMHSVVGATKDSSTIQKLCSEELEMDLSSACVTSLINCSTVWRSYNISYWNIDCRLYIQYETYTMHLYTYTIWPKVFGHP